jgi:diguanylate cyclase (GGDEF)-like protein
VALVGVLDWITGAELSFSIFYLLPIVLVAWRTGRIPGLVIATLAAACWYTADRLDGRVYSHYLIPVWNACVRWGFFILAVEAPHRLALAMRDAERLARTDPLTGLANARSFREAMKAELERAQRYHRPFSLAYIDVDNFKQVNDQLGHEAGDQLLEEVSLVFRRHLRKVDLTARLGGDEFAILIPEADANGAEPLVAKLQDLLNQLALRGRWPISFSIGLASFKTAPESVDSAIRVADELMYQVKHSGKSGIRLQTY